MERVERLTKRDRKGHAYFDDDGSLIRGANGTFHQKKDMTAQFIHQRFVALDKAIDRLAAYEDVGLTPEEIVAMQATLQALKEDAIPLLRAKIEERLVILPSKTVFELRYHPGPECNTICPVTIDGIGQCHFCDYGELHIYEVDCKQEHLDQIGKSIFLTRAEAEAALAEQKE